MARAALRAHLVGQYLVYAMAGLHVAALAGTSSSDEMGLLSECFPPKSERVTVISVCNAYEQTPAKKAAYDAMLAEAGVHGNFTDQSVI